MKPTRCTIVLTLAQAFLILVLILTIIPAAMPTVMLISLLQNADQVTQGIDTSSILLCLRDLALGACLVCAEMEGLSVLSRMKKSPAWTEKNDASLKRIIIALLIAGALSLLLGNVIFPYLLMLLSLSNPLLERLLMPVVLLGIALVIRLLQQKLRRQASGK